MNHTKIIFALALLLLFLFSTVAAIDSNTTDGNGTTGDSNTSDSNGTGTTTYQCTDSDGWKNYYTKGDIKEFTYVDGNFTSTQNVFDECVDAIIDGNYKEDVLREYFCNSENRIDFEHYECPKGCSNGACNPVGKCSVDSTKCTGIDYSKNLCGEVVYIPAWDGIEYTYEKACRAYDENGILSNWFFSNEDCTKLYVCSWGCNEGGCFDKGGNIKVTSNPSKARVYLNGQYIGKTPITSKNNVAAQNITVGKYTIEVKLKGYKNYKKTIEVKAGKTTPVHAKLKKATKK